MKQLLKLIAALPYSLPGKPAPAEDVIAVQQDLKFNGLPALPEDFVRFLHHVNTLNYDGLFIFGINPRSYFLDILSENLRLNLPQKENILILGYDEFEYLAYCAPHACYQIIDKDTLEVVETYADLTAAMKYLLKADDDEHL